MKPCKCSCHTAKDTNGKILFAPLCSDCVHNHEGSLADVVADATWRWNDLD